TQFVLCIGFRRRCPRDSKPSRPTMFREFTSNLPSKCFCSKNKKGAAIRLFGAADLRRFDARPVAAPGLVLRLQPLGPSTAAVPDVIGVARQLSHICKERRRLADEETHI